jgi:arylsulfatase A-like enzyme
LHVPLIMRLPSELPAGWRIPGITLHQDLVPTIMDLLDMDPGVEFDGRSQLGMLCGDVASNYDGFYITECTWMRKHGWRTSEWKLMVALEPDFHWKPEVELYNLVTDPGEFVNVADNEPLIRDALIAKMNDWVAKREADTGREAPIKTNLNWHGQNLGRGFESSQEAYDTLYIGSPKTAAKLQDKDSEEGKDG